MLKKFYVVILFVTVLLHAHGAAAQWRPWCLNQPGLTTTCIYYTFEQCLAARVGSSNYCSANPGYGDAASSTRRVRDRGR